MENMYDKLLLLKKSNLMSEQMIIENNILVEGDSEISKILAVNTNVDLDYPLEALNGECMASGKVICDLVYLNSDGEVNSESTTSPFNYKFINTNIKNGCKLIVKASAVASEIDKIVNNQIKIISTINFEGTISANEECEYLKEAEDGTFLKQQESEVCMLSSMICDKFEEGLEAVVKTGVKKVLMVNVESVVKDWTSGPNFAQVEGELYARVLYVDKQEIPELQTITISKNFKQEIEVNGLNKNFDLDVFVEVISGGVATKIDEKEDGTAILINVPILACVSTYESNKILSVADVYSSRDVISVQNDEVQNSKICKPEYLDGKIEGGVTLSDNEPRIDKYLATTNACVNVSNVYINGGEMFVEGVVTANVIYLNDELGAIQSVQIEVPFVLDKKTNVPEKAILQAKVSIFDVDTMVKRGREIYFDAKLKAFVNASCENVFGMVTRLEKIAELPERKDAIEIYFGKAGETFWDIAKNLKIPSEIIRSQNPELSDPLDKDQNIALYFQKERKN